MAPPLTVRIVRFVTGSPRTALPEGQLAVHNPYAMNARALIVEPDPQGDVAVEPCTCGWAPALGVHYRVGRGERPGA
jgi:hypothetical protein